MRAVITSVNYADVLAVTLQAWRDLLPPDVLTVATSPTDRQTQDLARDYGVPTIVTDAWTRTDATCHRGGSPVFNKAFGLDVAFGFTGAQRPEPAPDELCVSLDVDVYPFGEWPDASMFGSAIVYGYHRFFCPHPRAFDQHRTGDLPLTKFPRLPNCGGLPIGYCQVFRWQPGIRFGSYPTAGNYDVYVLKHFTKTEMRPTSELYLFHLGQQGDAANWSGRTVPIWGAA